MYELLSFKDLQLPAGQIVVAEAQLPKYLDEIIFKYSAHVVLVAFQDIPVKLAGTDSLVLFNYVSTHDLCVFKKPK